MEDDLKKNKNGRRPQKKMKMEDGQKKNRIKYNEGGEEEDLKKKEKKRRPIYFLKLK